METTLRWAQRSKQYFEDHKQEVPWRGGPGTVGRVSGGDEVEREKCEPCSPGRTRPSCPVEAGATQALFGIVQGGMDFELRRQSAERTVAICFPGYALGGLSVGEPRQLTREVVEATLGHLPVDKPRYLMGVGTPEEIAAYASLGVDMMDCVLPTRAARHGLLFTSEGRLNIKNMSYGQDQRPPDPRCGCKVCSRHSRAYLRHLFVTADPLAGALNTVHNLAFYLDTMRAVRHAIYLGVGSGILSGSVSSKPA